MTENEIEGNHVDLFIVKWVIGQRKPVLITSVLQLLSLLVAATGHYPGDWPRADETKNTPQQCLARATAWKNKENGLYRQ